jgi:hypothetical protein
MLPISAADDLQDRLTTACAADNSKPMSATKSSAVDALYRLVHDLRTIRAGDEAASCGPVWLTVSHSVEVAPRRFMAQGGQSFLSP